ncbi:MAG TPA: hypothetical protein VLL76_11090 [Candidatus Omnitrophota bacterium]|nr:hypothetical protein [Candidatus Omnitrophota bacterium]
MTRLACLTAAAVIAATALPDHAYAMTPPGDPFADFETVGRAELGDLRGGMMINGIPVDFAVVIRTTVEGALAANGLQTTVAVNDQGGIGAISTAAIGADGAVAGGGPSGVTMTLNGGGTSILHQVIDGQVQAMIANTVDRATISHQTQVNVTMPGFNEMTRTYFAHSHANALSRDSVMVGLGRF